jgi:hypothetical protein
MPWAEAERVGASTTLWPMRRWVGMALGTLLGGALGLFGPVFVLRALGVGSGSYEDVLPVWLFALPVVLLGGGVLGWRLGSRG